MKEREKEGGGEPREFLYRFSPLTLIYLSERYKPDKA